MTIDSLFVEPQQCGTFLGCLVRDLDCHDLALRREWDGDMQSRSHDGMLGIKLVLPNQLGSYVNPDHGDELGQHSHPAPPI